MSITILADSEAELLQHLALVLKTGVAPDTECLSAYARFVFFSGHYAHDITPEGQHVLYLPDNTEGS